MPKLAWLTDRIRRLFQRSESSSLLHQEKPDPGKVAVAIFTVQDEEVNVMPRETKPKEPDKKEPRLLECPECHKNGVYYTQDKGEYTTKCKHCKFENWQKDRADFDSFRLHTFGQVNIPTL